MGWICSHQVVILSSQYVALLLTPTDATFTARVAATRVLLTILMDDFYRCW